MATPKQKDFWDRVDKKGPDECWPWLGSLHPNGGHGSCHYAKYKERYAHRLAWFLTYGEILNGLKVLHHCDNPPCCNPAHLWLGTILDNLEDMRNKGRGACGEASGSAKLTEQEVLEIRHLYSKGDIGQRQLALNFGVEQVAISEIIRGNYWKHIGGPTR